MAFLGGLFGGSHRYAREAAKMSAQMKKWWAMYQGPMLGRLAEQVAHPRTGYDDAQMNTGNADTLNQYTQRQDQVKQSLANRGVGAGTSSYGNNTMGAYWQAYGDDMAKARALQDQQIEARRQQSISALLGQANTLGQNAMGGFQTAQSMVADPMGDMIKYLAQVGKFAATVAK
ncbi:MAG TPA: hypothetical protein VGL77_11105 [Armatimonadota bacterium]|jgi:uncharacterized protein YbjQ (UPF0145 family)